ncbi:lytic polysaccharide monooxygenase auxiliary activity family 9 protein [Streptomyces sp. NBC_01257]|uniref:lytic polysaccharide monooxygenase auxiliary activity family 9 protein n=1 Tax=Streptomyces sp. NBC_01257 TaxID=2903799 RepID=UPI002DDB0BFF|nr:lytic polysaccharide monooxygenase [Streptomyces sp. NBC_01257]WRZ63964.1 lytic polysaccharide monooxygenase [Streptomyces sp. NBC_01257]
MPAITPARRRAAAVVALGATPLVLTALAAAPASAHGSLTDPVSRVSACFAEGPEHPESAACVAAVAAGGTQALYDWNGVNIADAAGNHRQLIPDGKLCSAGNDKFKGLDLPRADWPATDLKSGPHTFRFRATAPHRGSFALYLTTASYDPAKPLKWSDLEAKPFAEATDPRLVDGSYVFDGTVPERSGRQLIYTVWQRSDSPEAFYACSDVVFGGSGGGAASGSGSVAAVPAPAASAPSEQEITEGEGKSSVEHGGHGDDDAGTGAAVTEATGATAPANAPEPDSASDDVPVAGPDRLAETGGSAATRHLAMGGAATIALGAVALLLSVRRRAAAAARRGL